jgi:hypothetical protein
LVFVILPHLLVPEDSLLHLGAIFVLINITRAHRLVPALQAFNLDALLLEQAAESEAFLDVSKLLAVTLAAPSQLDVALELVDFI